MSSTCEVESSPMYSQHLTEWKNTFSTRVSSMSVMCCGGVWFHVTLSHCICIEGLCIIHRCRGYLHFRLYTIPKRRKKGSMWHAEDLWTPWLKISKNYTFSMELLNSHRAKNMCRIFRVLFWRSHLLLQRGLDTRHCNIVFLLLASFGKRSLKSLANKTSIDLHFIQLYGIKTWIAQQLAGASQRLEIPRSTYS